MEVQVPLLSVPVLLGITAVTGLAGTAVSAIGAETAAKGQANAAKYNAAVEANNAGAAGQQAKFNAQQIQDETARNIANQRAAMAASGFDANSGTFVGVQADTKQKGELQRLSSIYQGRLGINRSMSASQLSSSEAGYDTEAGGFAAGSSILGGVSQATKIFSNPAFQP